MKLWLIEGLPGTGKSTIAEHLCRQAKESGYDALWYREESADHPVHFRSLTKQRSNGQSFIEACLQSWLSFTEKCQNDGAVHILEGSAFQSTVRFMMEERLVPIEDYYQRFEEIVEPLNPRIVYFRTRNASLHSRYVSELRGSDWSAKVSSYLERTPFSISAGLKGLSGMHGFWAAYAQVCDELAERTKMPIKFVEFVPGDWKRHMSEAAEFFGLGVLGFNTTFDAGKPTRGAI